MRSNMRGWKLRSLCNLKGKRVGVFISGGVDSAVSALMLQRSGVEVVGIHLSTWDDDNDVQTQASGRVCEATEALKYAMETSRRLGIRLERIDLAREYWNEVFIPAVEQFAGGVLNPNPDVMCNEKIKFGRKLLEHQVLKKLQLDWVATGHYAQILEKESEVKLLAARDWTKDQSWFLSTVEPGALNQVVFPIGNLSKSEVRAIAKEENLPSAFRKSSSGLCFVGKRYKNFRVFLEDYIPQKDQWSTQGDIVELDSGNSECIGKHHGLWRWAFGQKTGISSHKAYYVIKKEPSSNSVYVSSDSNHPLLFRSTLFLSKISWINPYEFRDKSEIEVLCPIEFRGKLIPCKIEFRSECRVHLSEPLKGVNPGQALVFYRQLDGYNELECLGAGIISVNSFL